MFSTGIEPVYKFYVDRQQMGHSSHVWIFNDR